jgi:geranylgeranyl diphosphate synthase type II
LTLAFEVLGGLDAPADRKARLVLELAKAAGTVGGMIAGQVDDIEGEGQQPTPQLLDTIHRAKTGALLCCSLRMGAIYAGASEEALKALTCYGLHIGLAFQIVDDILDVTQSSEELGKTAGKDAAQQKITFPSVYGLAESHRMAEQECAHAHRALGMFGDRARRLHDIADLVITRKK